MNRHDWFLFYLLTAFLFGCVLFLVGFFPLDFQKAGQPPSPDPPTDLNGIILRRPQRQVSNVILMIVDAMRYDFSSKTHMPYSSQHCKIKLKVNSPTVTLPRIKSLTSGTISNFIDVILNLGSSQPIQDSILHKLHNRGDRIVFYGDITWVNLFSNLFKRYEGNTDSFYLHDFYEVDTNVTRHLQLELKNISNWEFLILHYSGLDRIGHVEGSGSEKIFLKLKEMDDVVVQIDKALSGKVAEPRPLVLVTADHGMRDGGGHGGNSLEESYVPLIATSRNCSRQERGYLEYNQVDIVPTLAVLLDLPLPSTSIGCIIPELIESMSDQDKLYVLYYNTMFLNDKAVANFGKANVDTEDYYSWYKTAKQAHREYLQKLQSDNSTSAYLYEQAKLNYIRSAHQISQLFAGSYTKFDFGMIVLGVMMTSLATILTLLICLTVSNRPRKTHDPLTYYGRILLAAISINTCGHVFNYFHTSHILLAFFVTIPIFIIILLLIELLNLLASSRMHQFDLDIPVTVAFGIIFQTFSLASSSFIEEEHQTWYYLGATYLLSLICKNVSRTRLKIITFSSSSMDRDILIFFSVLQPLKKAFVAVTLTVFVRRLNQTGDKWMRIPDIGDWFAHTENKVYLSWFLAISLFLLLQQLRQFCTPLQTVACIIACASVYCYRGAVDMVYFFHPKHFNSFLVLPFYWTSVMYILASSYLPVICGVADKSEKGGGRLCNLLGTNLVVFALISALLHKPHNVFLVFAMHFILRCGYNLCDNLRGPRRTMPSQIILVYKVALTICVSKMFFFYQGNSNGLATIDLNPGYIGQTQYNPILVGLMLTSNTYFAEIFGFLSLLLNLFQKQNDISIAKETNEFENNLSERSNYNVVTTLMATIKLLTTSVYLILMIAFRHHLFIFTVFSPKVLYECFAIFLYYINFSMTNLYFSVLNKTL